MNEQKKKVTRGQYKRKIDTAVVFIPKDKETQSMFFSDKGVRLTVTADTAVIATGFHRHVFDSITSAGISRPYLYTKRIIEIANENLTLIATEQGYSYQRLIDVLKEKDDKSEYNIAVYYDWFLFNIFQPLYGIGETNVESFLVYEDYVHNIARNMIILAEKTEDITNVNFIDKIIENMKSLTSTLEENVLIPRKSDEEYTQEAIDAIREQETNEAVEAQGDGASED